MSSRRVPLPAHASEAAKRCFDEAPPIEALDTGLEAIIRMRRELYDLVVPVNRRLAADLGVRVETAEVSNIPVQWVRPATNRGRGTVLYFFGGGHVTGSPDEDLAITARLAHGLGRPVCAPAYRLAPEHPYPAAIEDALVVYDGLLADPASGPIAVSGESAGGNLSLALVGALAAQRRPLPKALALLSPWCDLTHSGDTIRTLVGCDPTLDADLNLEAMARAYAAGRPRTSPEISPLFADVPSGFPPTLVTSGTRDLLLSDCARLTAKLRAAGVPVELHVNEGMWHVFEYYAALPEAEASLGAAAAFLDRHLA